MLTNEFPPSVYGGAGVHVGELAAALRGQVELDIRTFGDHDQDEPGWRVRGYPATGDVAAAPEPIQPVLGAFHRNLAMVADAPSAQLVHCHTWYTHLGGLLLSQAYGLPLVVTVHSLEPLRPWKREQLGGGYDLSAWVEGQALEAADAVIAVSGATRDDVLAHFSTSADRVHVVHNGINTDAWAPDPGWQALARFDLGPGSRYVLFVGRITRQKGISLLLAALRHVDPGIGVVLAAGQPDTADLAAEVEAAVVEARATRPAGAVTWIPEQLDQPTLRQLYSHAAAFVSPSVYEPFGITNLEAMACGTAVVATRVGGVAEVVDHGQTGLLVELPADADAAPTDATAARALAAAINDLAANPARAAAMGEAGRRRAVAHFRWQAIATRTMEVYEGVVP